MKSKSELCYVEAYQEFKNIMSRLEKQWTNICLTTDNEHALYSSFFKVFSSSIIDHTLCKRHYCAALTRNLAKHGLSGLVMAKSRFFDQNFHVFFGQIQILGLLPDFLIVPMKNFLLEKLEANNIEGTEAYISYLNNTITNRISVKMSFYEKIMKSSRYIPQTTNSSESGNGRLNQFIFSLSRSRKINTIARSLRTFMITDYRRKELMYIDNKSSYLPSESALENYRRAKLFVQKIHKIGLYPNRGTMKKIEK